MSSLTYTIENDYEIKINDVVGGEYTGEFLTLGGEDDYCGVSFDGVGSPDLEEVTYGVSGGDGVQFGVERYQAINWNITGAIHSSLIKNTPGDPELTWNAWSKLYRAWVDYPGRTSPRTVIPLYFKRPGREAMVVYGRPRRIDPATSASHAGMISYTAQFKQSDPRFYSAEEFSYTAALQSSSTGGIVLNDDQDALPLPFSTTLTVPRTGFVTNAGDAPSNPVIIINGPVFNPAVLLVSESGIRWRIELLTSVAAGLSVSIDTRQWARTIMTADGASLAGSYRGDRLQDIVIPPGSYEFEYTGIDGTGTSSCEIRYRNAWSST